MDGHQDDLDLLLSLHQDRVLETPPASPSSHSPGYLSDEGFRKRRRRQTDMSVFRDAVQECLDYDTETAKTAPKSSKTKKSNDAEAEKFSGLRIKNQLVSPVELSNRFSDIRFVRLPAIKNLLRGDTLSGCWATVGVLTEKGSPKTSSTGKTFAIWKMGCLDEKSISLFLFGDAYQKNCNEKAGTVFALFNCSIRTDKSEHGFSLSVFSANHILKIGTSMDFGVCKGKRKDGMTCTVAINKRRGTYCSYHRVRTSEKYFSTRNELKGGNLRTAFRDPFNPGKIFMVDPLADKTNFNKSTAPVKILSVDGLKKALSNAGKVTTNEYSQGIRFLTEVTGKMDSGTTSKKQTKHSEKRLSSTLKNDKHRVGGSEEQGAKRMNLGHRQEVPGPGERHEPVKEKMIELDFVSSDEEL